MGASSVTVIPRGMAIRWNLDLPIGTLVYVCRVPLVERLGRVNYADLDGDTSIYFRDADRLVYDSFSECEFSKCEDQGAAQAMWELAND